MSRRSVEFTILSACVLLLTSSLSAAPADTSDDFHPTTTTTQSPRSNDTTTAKANATETSHADRGGESTELPEFTSDKDTSTFTCHGRVTGYYADVRLACRVYHFCTQLDGIGGTTYQRMSYICLEGSFFDQRDLNCVKESDLKVPCNKAESEYESSNKQFDPKEDNQPSMSDNLAANIMMNPLTRFIAGRR